MSDQELDRLLRIAVRWGWRATHLAPHVGRSKPAIRAFAARRGIRFWSRSEDREAA